MADTAPTQIKITPRANLTDDMCTADAFRACGNVIGSELIESLRYHYEKITGLAASGGIGDERLNYPHCHAQLETGLCGETVRRTPWQRNFGHLYSSTHYDANWYTVTNSAWEEVYRDRAWVGGFRKLKTVVEYVNTDTPGASVKWKVEQGAANDGADMSAADHYIEETSGTAHAEGDGRGQWHSILGPEDGAGGDVNLLTVDGPTSATDLADLLTEREVVVYARAVGVASCTLKLYNLSVHEQLTTD